MKCRYYSEIMRVYNEEIKKLEEKLRRTQIKCNSAQFEVERLQKENNVLEIEKKNAVKEFADKLKGKLQDFGDGGEKGAYISEKDIYELLKEYEQ